MFIVDFAWICCAIAFVASGAVTCGIATCDIVGLVSCGAANCNIVTRDIVGCVACLKVVGRAVVR